MRAIARVPHTCARTDTAAIEDVFVAASASMTYLPELYTEAETRAFVRDVLLPNNEVWVAEDAGHVIAWYRPAFSALPRSRRSQATLARARRLVPLRQVPRR